MAALDRLEGERLAAEIRSIEKLIESLTEEDIVARLSLEDRLAEALDELASLPAVGDQSASVALFFGGMPVIGQRGIESEFAGEAVTRFQDLISKLLAKEIGQLGQRGPVPNRASSAMHITNVVRGSFGFLLEELRSQGELVDTALKKAVDEAGQLMVAFGSDDDEAFQQAVDESDTRIIATLTGFLSHVHESDATFRFLTETKDHSFDARSLEIAAKRAVETKVDEVPLRITGVLIGILPEGHRFEFRTDDGVISGIIAREIETAQLTNWTRNLLNQPATGEFIRKDVYKDADVIRSSFRLVSLDLHKLGRLPDA